MANNNNDITSILEKADRENEEQRQIEYKASVNNVVAEKSETKQTAEQKKERPKDETSELIDKYSQKQVEDKKTSSDALREAIENQMSNDGELFSYYRAIERKGKSKKVEELYNLINTATLADGGDIPKKNASSDVGASHFSDKNPADNKEKYSQQKFFDMEDTVDIPTEGIDKPAPKYDEDYDKLSEKIEKGKIVFDDNTDTRQIQLVDEKPHVANGINREYMDTKDRDLLLMFDMNGKEEAEDGVKEKKESKQKKKHTAEAAYEYYDRNQNSDILEMLMKAIRQSTAAFVFSMLLLTGIVYLELASKDSKYHFEFCRPGRHGVLYTLYDIQLLCFMALVQLKSFINGCKGLFTGKPSGESVFFASFCVSIIYAGATVILAPDVPYGLICMPAALCGACMALVKMLQCRKDYHCFKVVASSRSKYVAEKLDGNSKEAIEFYKHLFDSSEVYTTGKASFVNGFFRRLNTRPEGESLSGFGVIISLAAAAAMLGFRLFEHDSAYDAITAMMKTLAFSLPITSLLIVSLPVIKANLIGKKNGSAFIGNAVGEEYADAAVISFSDTEVYPSNLVKITSVTVFGDTHIDEIICDIANVFALVGGPLKSVTENMLTERVTPPQSIRLIESAANGICVVMDGRKIFMGKREYMRKYRFEVPYDENDGLFERKNGSVMYITSNNELVAKIFVRYSINPQFNSLLREIYKAGMCVGIKTSDPNITAELIERSVKFKKTPISILKTGSVENTECEKAEADSGVVANASLHTFLRMFVVCDKIRHITKANGIINMLSIMIAFFISFFLSATNQLITLPSLYQALFQLVWTLPIAMVSFLL